jgi:hypothetical protein
MNRFFLPTLCGLALLANLLGARAAEAQHARPWSFDPPIRPALPALSHTSWGVNPVDQFLAAQQEAHKIIPVEPAPARLLLRRLYLDLIGLPPTRDELDRFERDPTSYEKIVDELLERPQYGERWGRHWMDVWRYSDWFGLGDQLRNSQKHIWHWRDWIIESLNEDKGYDRMLLEMLAADELTPTDRETLRATGFLARQYFLFNRTTWLDDTIEHTAQAFLGLTMNCAKCHDHKYDPVTQVDYYRFRAVFEPYQVRLDAWPGQIDLEKNGLPRVYDAHLDVPTYLQIRGDAKNLDTNQVITPGLPKSLASEELKIVPLELALGARAPSLQPFVLEDQLRAAQAEIDSAQRKLEAARQAVAQAEGSNGEAAAGPNGSQPAVDDARAKVLLAEKVYAAAQLRPVTLRAAYEADLAKAQGAADVAARVQEAAQAERADKLAQAERDETRARQLLAGAAAKEKEKAEKDLKAAHERLEKARQANESSEYTPIRASLKALEGPDETEASRFQPYPTASTGRRLALARWIVDRQNPLTARVAVNHIWLRHFGQPLVETVNDFGNQSKEPVQRALLDWLAVELMESGWSMKHLHRLMVTSQAYRFSSSTATADTQTVKTDPENHLYWRHRSTRMEAEVIRDSLLSLAGALDPMIGGPTVDPKQGGFRRSLYFTHSRDDHDEFLSMFDDADVFRCYRRTESLVPQQALTLANSRLALTMSRRIAEQLTHGQGAVNDDQFVSAAFETILALPPTAEERLACRQALEQTRAVLKGQSRAAERAQEDLVHALINHNDFITIR